MTNTARIHNNDGFSSSICGGLFRNPQRHSDCCALACCGLLLSDLNYYTSTHSMPPPWYRRFLMNVGIPLLTMVLLRSFMPASYGYISAAIMTLVILLLCTRGWYYRYRERQAIMRLLYEQEGDDTSGDDVDAFLQRHRCSSIMSTAVCGCVKTEDACTDGGGDDQTTPATIQGDFCTSLWTLASKLCCGALCCCWCSCCGMCAIAQQDRALQQELQPQEKVDYITFQPWEEYSFPLQQLRTLKITSFWKHVSKMSRLSYKLLYMLAASLVILLIIALLQVERNFSLKNLLVVLATFFQAFFILYFVHWQWHRFDLSLDAVVKYFSSGFLLCTGLAVVFELLLSTVLSIIMNLIILLIAISEKDEMPTTTKEAQEFSKAFQKEHLLLFCVYTFFNAFFVAALVEETTKYFGFWMVEHPDLDHSSRNPASKESQGVAVTVAMVATALGFACCENLLYVFVYTPPSLANEVATLVARSIFPIHPLAAALQSIGVCRRDLEGDTKVGLGRILIPAVLLHGSFDFVLMVMALIQSVESTTPSSVDDDDDTGITDDDHSASSSNSSLVQDQLPSLIGSVTIVIVGLVYYVWQAEAQRIRLHELDIRGSGARLPSGETTPLLL